MLRKRINFSFSVFQTALFGIGGIAALIVSFVLGILIGKEIQGNSIFNSEVKSQIVKMRIEPLTEVQSPVNPSGDGKQSAMDNATSRPLITFYDTLSKKGMTEPPSSRHSPGKEPQTANTDGERKKETDNAPKKSYTVQAGAMKDKALADAMVSKLKKAGYSAYIASSESSGKGTWYRVRLGTFPNKEDAQREVAKIKKNEGMQATVVEK